MSKLTWGKFWSIVVAILGLIVQYTPTIQGWLPSLPLSPKVSADLGLIITLLGGISTQILSAIHSHQLEQFQNATPDDAGKPTAPVSAAVKTSVLLIGFLLLASAASAQVSYEQYQGGFKFANTSVPSGTTVNGAWLAPVALGNITPVIFNNGQITLGASIGIEAGYGILIGSGTSNGSSLNITPKFLAVPYIGDNAIQNGSIYVSNALVGIGLGVPSILPNTLIGPSYNLANNMLLLSISVFAGPLDFLGGTGVFHL